MKDLPLLMCATFCRLNAVQADAADNKKNERPNILWFTFEDTSAYEFGCYGNKGVHTPNADSLAVHGIQFMSVWLVAPQSPAVRSSLITGCYSSSYGMNVHPVPYDTLENMFFPRWLREAGYYYTNNNKTHYNSTTDNKSCWDKCTPKASYNSTKRGKDQPFFAVYNTATSHMGRIRIFHTDGRRDYTTEGIYSELLILPSYVPDLPGVCSDYTDHLGAVQDVDTWLGFFLKDLKERGLDDNTIIFSFSDHGGCVPRGKGYLYESGLRAPMIAYFPPKWQHLAGKKASGKEYSLVNFTDLGPAVLNLAGVKPPKHMQDKALYGKYASDEKREIQFALAANQLYHFMPVRAAIDGRFKYIRSYIPYHQFALRNYYQWDMPSNKVWDKLVLGGHNINPDWAQAFNTHPTEMSFDLERDPDKLHNLSDSPEYAEVLAKMRKALFEHIHSAEDLGFFIPTSRVSITLYDKVRKEKYPLNELYSPVELAGTAKVSDASIFGKVLSSQYPEMRYWASVGLAQLGIRGELQVCPSALLTLMNDVDPYIAYEAAYAATYLGETSKGIEHLSHSAKEADRKVGYSLLECLPLDKVMQPAIRTHLVNLKEKAKILPRKANEDAGLMACGVLANLGEMDIKGLHEPESYKLGLKLNHERKPMVPLSN